MLELVGVPGGWCLLRRLQEKVALGMRLARLAPEVEQAGGLQTNAPVRSLSECMGGP